MSLSNADTRSAAGLTIAFEPLSARLLPSARPNHYWECYGLSAAGIFVVNPAIAPQQPACGLYLAPSTTRLESLADAQAGINLDARGIIIACDWTVLPFVPGVGFPFACSARLQLPLIVTPEVELRFIANVNPGNAAPGPGAGSTVLMTAQFAER